MKRLWNYVVTMWQPLGLFIVGCLLVSGLFAYRLHITPPFESSIEVSSHQSNLGVSKILKNPINAPYKTAELIASKLHDSIVTRRLVSGLIAGLCLLLFYALARRFTNRYAAFLGACMLATSSSLLHAGRLADPGITFLALLALVVIGYQFRFHNERPRSWIFMTLAVTLALYTPGMLWFIIAGVTTQYVRKLKKQQKLPDKKTLGICVAIFIIGISPLIYGFIQQPSIWRDYLLLPASFPSITKLVLNVLAVPYGIFINAPTNPLYRLGHQPLLDIFASAMFIVGILALLKRFKLDRLILFIGVFLLGILLTAVSGNYENSFMIVPFIYLIIAIGIGYMLQEWKSVFPHNPLARWLSVVIMTLAVLVSCNFQARRYFVAWPNNPTTKAALQSAN